MILRFVQKGFAYQTDDQQFGYEKVFFPEETLYYPYSDCEDRSILFAHLVEKLLSLKVVFLHYEGHLATAVAMTGGLSNLGDHFSHRGKIYTVADPTYINSSLGMTMPQHRGVKYKVIE